MQILYQSFTENTSEFHKVANSVVTVSRASRHGYVEVLNVLSTWHTIKALGNVTGAAPHVLLPWNKKGDTEE